MEKSFKHIFEVVAGCSLFFLISLLILYVNMDNRFFMKELLENLMWCMGGMFFILIPVVYVINIITNSNRK